MLPACDSFESLFIPSAQTEASALFLENSNLAAAATLRRTNEQDQSKGHDQQETVHPRRTFYDEMYVLAPTGSAPFYGSGIGYFLGIWFLGGRLNG